MVFSSNIFLFLFLPLVIAVYFLPLERFLGRKYKNNFLLIASLFFYSWGETKYIILLLSSIIGNYYFGLLISKEKKYSLVIAITFNLALLCYFKYANFFVDSLNSFGISIENKKILLPIGISFFTFHAISYLIDIYRKKCEVQRNLLDLALYIAFFPQLIAGPIVRYNFIQRFLTTRTHSAISVSYGIRRFIIGLGKKVIIANPLGEVADAVFSSGASDLTTPIAWVGIFCYSLQIYFDFSGYSDMAIGLARVFGFKFPENFNYPYVARSIKDFWRRWHISLSSWFRDYLYIPLGGNRVSITRQYLNLVLVFFLCGLWHGASWNFVIWGLFHGLFLVLERGEKYGKALNYLPKLLQNFYAIFLVMIGWVFFRSPDLVYSMDFLKVMFVGNDVGSVSNDILKILRSHFVWMSLSLALIGFSPLMNNVYLKIRRVKCFSYLFDFFLIFVLFLCVTRLSAATHNPFIYFQF